MSNSDLFKEHSVSEHAKAIADYLPNGRPFEAKNVSGTVMNNLLLGQAEEFKRFEDMLRKLARELDPQCTEELLPEWERHVGIPDDCFSGTGTVEERRAAVIVKYAQSNVQTEEDFIKLAETLGFTITISHLSDECFPPYTPPFIPCGLPQARFIWIVRGENIVPGVPPYIPPFIPTISQSPVICVFNKLKPAHTKIIFENT